MYRDVSEQDPNRMITEWDHARPEPGVRGKLPLLVDLPGGFFARPAVRATAELFDSVIIARAGPSRGPNFDSSVGQNALSPTTCIQIFYKRSCESVCVT